MVDAPAAVASSAFSSRSIIARSFASIVVLCGVLYSVLVADCRSQGFFLLLFLIFYLFFISFLFINQRQSSFDLRFNVETSATSERYAMLATLSRGGLLMCKRHGANRVW